MFRFNNIKQNLLIVTIAALLTGCGGGGSTDSTTIDSTTSTLDKVVQVDISATPTEDSATIEWISYGYITKSVEYGTSNKYGSEVLVQEEGTVTLSNLQADTEYHYRIVSEDENGKPVVSKDQTFTTLPASTQPSVTEPAPSEPIVTEPAPIPLTINSIANSNTTENSTDITWELSNYATGQIEYGITNNYGSFSSKEDSFIYNIHSQTLANLTPDTIYHYRIISTDDNGNTVISEDQTFTTLPASTEPIVTEPVPSEPIVTEPAPTEPTVTEPAPTEPIVTEPIVTEPAPIPLTINFIENVSTTENSTLITWELSNYATGQIEYGITNNYGNFSTKEDSFIYNIHSQTLANLTPDTIYHYRVISTDENGNTVISEDQTFKTLSVCQSGPAQQLGQIKDSTSDTGLVDVTVTIAGCSTKTDANGFYTLNNIAVNDKAVVNFEKDGYLLGSTSIQIKELYGDNTPSTNYLEYTLDTYDTQWSYDSQNGTTSGAVEVPSGTIHTDETGNVYNGIVYSRWVFKDTMTTEGRDAFPGAFEGINNNGIVVPFVSYGLMSVELKDENSASLSLSENITLVLPSVTGTNESILPLWYYDYDQGLWIEEGYAERQPDGTYRGDISHPGTWSLSQPIEVEVGIYRGYILNTDGSPMSDVRVHAVGDNWISSDLSTDENGLFELEVIPDSSFQLSAYNYKDQYEATYSGTIAPIASGEIVAN